MSTGSFTSIHAERTTASGVAAASIGSSYRVLSHIGSGQMAEVYMAQHVQSGTTVAVKIVRRELCADATVRARFRLEVEAVARLQSPRAIRFFDFGETSDGQLYIVMEYLAGEDLRTYMTRVGPSTREQALAVVTQVADALGDAHSAGIIHRDVKPENIQFVRDGSDAVKVLDFGFAKLLDPCVRGNVTAKLTTVGTPAYIAPEIAVAGRSVDWRSDLYSLAVITFELLTGTRPFHGATPMTVMLAHLHQPIPSARALVPDLPRSIDTFFQVALAKSPQARIASAELFSRALISSLQIH